MAQNQKNSQAKGQDLLSKATNKANSTKSSGIPEKYRTPLYLVGIFLAIFVFFWGAITNGGFNSSDNIASHSFINYLDDAKSSGDFPLWIPYIFGGMPSFASLLTTGNRTYDFFTQIFLGITKFFGWLFSSDVARVIIFYLFYGIGMFLLMRHKKHTRFVAFLTAFGAVFSTYVITWAMIGHNTKPIVLAMFPFIFLFLEKLKDKFSLLHTVLLVLAVHFMIEGNHIQMMFYGIIAFSIYLIIELVNSLNKKAELTKIFRIIVLLIFAGGIGFLMSSDRYFATLEYTPYSTRGVAPLKEHVENHIDKPVRDYKYSTMWSFNPGESISFLVPGFFGTNPIEFNGQEQPFYFGAKESEDSPPYMGIGFLCLGLIGFILYRKDPFVQSMGLISIVSLILSFGKFSPGSSAWYVILFMFVGMGLLINSYRKGNINKALFWFCSAIFLVYLTGLVGIHSFDMFKLYDALFWNLPMFYSFRAPSMALALIQFAVPILAGYGLTGIIKMRNGMTSSEKRIVYGLGIASAVFLIFGFVYSGLFESTYKSYIVNKFAPMMQGQEFPNEIIQSLISNMTADWYFSAFLMIILSGAVYMFVNKKINSNIFLGVILISFIVDLWRVDFRAMNYSDGNISDEVFAPYEQFYGSIKQQDNSLYRVADLTAPHDNMLAHFRLQSVGGYHAAKLRVYQDLMDLANIDNFAGSTHQLVNPFLWNLMNVKYVIMPDANRQPAIQPNPTALPRAFFVNNYAVAKPIDILRHLKLGDFNPKDTVFLEKNISESIEPAHFTALVEIKEYKNEYIKIQTKNLGNNFLFISEIYYEPSWKAYIDGKETPIYKSNYAFRGIIVPAGEHQVELKFRSEKFETGKSFSLVLNIVALLALLGGLFFEYKKKKNNKIENIEE